MAGGFCCCFPVQSTWRSTIRSGELSSVAVWSPRESLPPEIALNQRAPQITPGCSGILAGSWAQLPVLPHSAPAPAFTSPLQAELQASPYRLMFRAKPQEIPQCFRNKQRLTARICSQAQMSSKGHKSLPNRNQMLQ